MCVPGPGCPKGYVLVTAGLLSTLLDFARGDAAHDAKFGFLEAADLGRVVLLAHSAGGSVAMRMLSGLLMYVLACVHCELGTHTQKKCQLRPFAASHESHAM